MKSFAILVTTGMLFATSLAYVTPAFADDNDVTIQSAPADNNSQPQTQSNPMGSDNPNNNPDTNIGADQATPDTATGDDDY